jgi:MarR family 2-MHQ and catechol resistance regulon transcriptional repressor
MLTGPYIRLILWKAAKAVEKVDRASIAQTGLGLSDFTIMEALLHKGPLPINQIGEKVLLTSGSMTAAVDRMKARGLVRRIKDPSDGRCFFVHLTKKGRHTIKKAYAEHAKNLEKIAAVLSDSERRELVRLLKKIGLFAESLGSDTT